MSCCCARGSTWKRVVQVGVQLRDETTAMLTVPQKTRRGARGEPPNPVEGVGNRPAILRDGVPG